VGIGLKELGSLMQTNPSKCEDRVVDVDWCVLRCMLKGGSCSTLQSSHAVYFVFRD
jgi:hypothetical protein